MQKYKFNHETLNYEPIKPDRIKQFIVTGIIICFATIAFMLAYGKGEYDGRKVSDNKWSLAMADFKKQLPANQIDMTIGSQAWKDSVFTEYAERANLYLAKEEFEGTPLKGEMMALAAYNAYDSTGVLLPVELALAQCQHESSMGRKGRSPKNNPYNVGEFNTKTVMWFDSTFEGVQKYYYLMCNDYLQCKTVSELLDNFTNCAGKRYAYNPDPEAIPYEVKISNQISYIKKWTDEQIANNKSI